MAQSRKAQSRKSMLVAWGAVGLVIVVIVALVVVKLTGGGPSTTTSFTPVTPAPASVVRDVTTIPSSVYDKVGVTSTVALNPPLDLRNQPVLMLDGKPGVLFVGAEYCPFCAAERWALVTSLARFGSFSNLKITASSHSDVDPATHTFSFQGSTYTSPDLTFQAVEQVSNTPDSRYDPPYKPLDTITPAQQRNLDKYEQPPLDPTATKGQFGYPFVNLGNQLIVDAFPYDPIVLTGLTWNQIAGGLDNPASPVTQAILASSNYLSAAICDLTDGQPATVCLSSGVLAAAKHL